MEGSDPQWPSAGEASVAESEATTPGEEARPSASVAHPTAGDDRTPPLAEAEADGIERAYFDLLERERTLPVHPLLDEGSLAVPRDPALDPTSTVAAPYAGASAAAPPAMQENGWRDIVRRVAHVAFLVLGGWFIAVLVLIVVYRFVDPPFSMLMAQRFIGGTSIHREWVPLERISPNLARAVIVAEDGRFCRHWGIDPVEAMSAIRRASDGYPRGASTITMQVAKNLFLVPAKSYLRKMVEIPLTFAIELAWSKRRILEVYLNIVEWGPGIFGAEAASMAHFGRPAASLSARQAAQLAAVLPNPIVRNAGSPGPRTARKASVIQARAAGAREASACVEVRR